MDKFCRKHAPKDFTGTVAPVFCDTCEHNFWRRVHKEHLAEYQVEQVKLKQLTKAGIE